MDLEKIKAVRDRQAEEFRYARQTAKIVTAINRQTKLLTEKIDELIATTKEAERKDAKEE